MKYFANMVCTSDEIIQYADFSSSNMVDYVPTCTDGPTASCEDDNCDILFDSNYGTSGTSYTIMAWINCINDGTEWAAIWHLSPTNENVPRNPSMWWRNDGTLWPCHT